MASQMSATGLLLAEALAAVEEAKIPADLQPVAFGKAIDLLGGTASRQKSAADGGPPAGEAGGGDRPLEMIRIKLGIDAESVDAAYHLDDDGQIQLGVPSRKLDTRKSAATKQIALLLAAGRQAAGAEERTSVGIIRDAVTFYGKRDGANFAGTIAEMDDVFNITGNGQQRRVKVNRVGYERAGEWAKALTGSGE
jgi:hypothetical protein